MLGQQSHMNWTLASTIRVAVGGIAGIVGLLLALRDGKASIPITLPWSFGRHSGSEKPLLVPGLQNLENNCFLNVVLQVKLCYNIG